MRTIIKNGTVIDGRNTKAFRADILVQDDKIAKICREEISAEPQDTVVDVAGCVVCPGFVDTHSHMDVQLLKEPYQESLIRQGITTSLLGQDGISMAPLPKKWISQWRTVLGGMDGDTTGLSLDYESVEGYLAELEKAGICTNAAYLVTHGNLRLEAMGMEDRQASAEELEHMKQSLRKAMEQGAVGLSTGLIYVPCVYGKTEELIELCRIVAEYDGVFVVHQRSEADDILNSMDEIMRIGRESGVKIHFSHFKACGRHTWDKIDAILEKLDRAEAEGIRVSFDQYPYVAGSTTLMVVLPPWVQDGGPEEMMRRMQDPDEVARMRKDIEAGSKNWDNFVDFAGWDGIFLTYVVSEKNKSLIGKSLQQMADEWNMDPLDATIRLLLEEKAQVSMVDFYGKEEHVRRFLNRREQNICTDGVISGSPHPRCYGTYPRVLGRYVRDEKVLSLEEAVYKATYKGACVIGMERDRGSIEEGKAADIVVFHPDTFLDRATYEQPIQFPEGMEMVMVNGQILYHNGKEFRMAAGQVIRRKGRNR